MKRVAWWTAFGAAALSAGVLAWWSNTGEQVALIAVNAAPAAPAASAASIALAGATPVEGATSSLAAKAVAVVPPASAPQVDKEFVELCGVGKVRRSELAAVKNGPSPAWMQQLDAKLQTALPDLARRLAASGALNERVAAAALRDDISQAALLASSGSDADAYRIALRACRHHTERHRTVQRIRQLQASEPDSGLISPTDPGEAPSACGLLSLEHLELMDGGDAWPWLVRLNDSMERSDNAGITQALYQLGQRDWASFNARPLGRTVAQAVGDKPSSMDAMAMILLTVKDSSGARDAAPALLQRSCRTDTLNDANRRQLCEQAVRRLAGSATEMDDGRALYMLEERLGLPHHPMSTSMAEMERGIQTMTAARGALGDDPTCANFSRMGQRVMAMARMGELGYLRSQAKAAVPAASR